VGDLERSIARICASSLGGFGRDNTAVVLYEDQAKKKVAAFLAVLRGLEKVQVDNHCGHWMSAGEVGEVQQRSAFGAIYVCMPYLTELNLWYASYFIHYLYVILTQFCMYVRRSCRDSRNWAAV
jgi:hypothetical protein